MSRFFQTMITAVCASAFLLGAPLQGANARPKPLKGPIPAFVERVVDGDTLDVRARIWLGQELRVKVRLSGVDAPEMRGRCTHERQMARSAKKFVKKLVGQRKIMLMHVRQGKYAGRVIADVMLTKGGLLSKKLLEAKLARPYKRGRRKSWCLIAKSEPRYETPGPKRVLVKSPAMGVKSIGQRIHQKISVGAE